MMREWSMFLACLSLHLQYVRPHELLLYSRNNNKIKINLKTTRLLQYGIER